MADDIRLVNDGRSQTLQPKFRAYAVVLGACISIALGWAAYIETGWARMFGGFFCLVIGALTEEGVRRETTVLQDCLFADGTITHYRKGRRGGAHVRYRFVGFNGAKYEGESFWNVRGLDAGGQITVVYNSHEPSLNLPLPGFLFHDFRKSTDTRRY